jgi:Putative zinc-finger
MSVNSSSRLRVWYGFARCHAAVMTSQCNDVFWYVFWYDMWDAAYVVGMLSAADRREFEAHMANCSACRDAVADLSGMQARLSQLDLEEVAAIEESRHTQSVTPAMSLPPRPRTDLSPSG